MQVIIVREPSASWRCAVPSRVLPTFRGRPLGELQSECVEVSGGSVGPRGLERRGRTFCDLVGYRDLAASLVSPPPAAVR